MEKLFYENYWDLLKLANTDAGKYLLASISHGKIPNAPIVKLSPNSFHQLIEKQGDTNLVEARFYCRMSVALKLLPILEKMKIAGSYKRLSDPYDAFLFYAGLKNSNKYPHLYLSTTFNPQAGDGRVRSFDGSSFTTARNQAGNGFDYTSADEYIARNFWSGEPQRYIYRGFLPFVTSSLGAGATVAQSGTSLQIYVSGKINNDSLSLGLIQTTQASVSSLADADYQHITLNSPNEGATRLTLSGLNTNAYNSFLANSNLVSWINVSGNTLLGCRTSADIDNTGFPASQNNDDGATIKFSENGSNEPQLVVALQVAGGFFLAAQ